MKRKIRAGTTNLMEPIRVYDSSSTTGAYLSGVNAGSAGLLGRWRRSGDAAWTPISIVSTTAGSYLSGGWAVPTGGPTSYEVHIPNAAIAAGAAWVEIEYYGVANMVPVQLFFELDAVDYQDAVWPVDVQRWLDKPVTADASDVPIMVLQDGSLTAAKIAANAITAAAIAANAIASGKIGPNAIDANVIANASITNSKFAAGAITNTVVADGFISSAKFAANAITAAAIAAAALNDKGNWLTTLGANAPANWINAAAVAAAALNGKGDWASTLQVPQAPLASGQTVSGGASLVRYSSVATTGLTLSITGSNNTIVADMLYTSSNTQPAVSFTNSETLLVANTIHAIAGDALWFTSSGNTATIVAKKIDAFNKMAVINTALQHVVITSEEIDVTTLLDWQAGGSGVITLKAHTVVAPIFALYAGSGGTTYIEANYYEGDITCTTGHVVRVVNAIINGNVACDGGTLELVGCVVLGTVGQSASGTIRYDATTQFRGSILGTLTPIPFADNTISSGTVAASAVAEIQSGLATSTALDNVPKFGDSQKWTSPANELNVTITKNP